ncbi:hypothetical protein SLEP1_g33948 [Rubroshorea leprosula]|uniref:Uncharacterized protein n=1 Tax=Rubroshorea leprosula TaxID=152421 RepID=A0AAV5KI74_9ROSI|nr:hypothetical protein SLEP1_g33948 [Rubroshorea leprosula]
MLSPTLNPDPPPAAPSLPPLSSVHNKDEVMQGKPTGSTDPPKSFRDTLLDGSAPKSLPMVTYEELVEANITEASPMAEDGVDPTKEKVPKVKIPQAIWQRLCVPSSLSFWGNLLISTFSMLDY